MQCLEPGLFRNLCVILSKYYYSSCVIFSNIALVYDIFNRYTHYVNTQSSYVRQCYETMRNLCMRGTPKQQQQSNTRSFAMLHTNL